MNKKRDVIVTVVFVFIFLVGLSVMLYPSFADWWNRTKATHAITNYQETVSQMKTEDTQAYFDAAHEYNDKLADLDFPFSEYEKIEGYEDILNVSGSGVMGYISIPALKINLPVYHGTDEGILQIAAGHIQGSSLPVGGPSTHAVISGHRGLPSAKLFTDIDKMVEGDIFTVTILDKVMTYEVEKIIIILPEDLEPLTIIPNEELLTLMTCTPYGINTHRLLVRAHRIDSETVRSVKITADAMQVDRLTVIPYVFLPLLILLIIYWMISSRLRKSVEIDKYISEKLPDERECDSDEKNKK